MIFKLVSNLISILNIFLINIYFYLLKLKKKKIIVFYHGLTGSYINHDYIINEIIARTKFSSNDISFHIVHEFLLFKNFYYFINLRFIRFLLFVDIIIVNNSKRLLPKNSTKVLIPHDVYDTAAYGSRLVNFSEIFLLQFNFILCSNKIALNLYNKKIKLYLNNLNYKLYANSSKKIELIDIGYFKLDILLEKINASGNIKKDSILILLSNTGHFLNKKVIILIKLLLKEFSMLNIILRPHPGHYKQNIDFYNFIKNSFLEYKNFQIDSDAMYINSFIRSKLAIAEMSGSAYSFAFSTLRPVANIFKTINLYQRKSYYFKDANSIGLKSFKDKELINNLRLLLNKSIFYKNKIKKLRKKRILNLSKSFINFNKFLEHTLNNRSINCIKREIYFQ